MTDTPTVLRARAGLLRSLGYGNAATECLVAAAQADLDNAIAVRYAARDRYLASGTQADLDALNAAVKLQDEASAALAKLGR